MPYSLSLYSILNIHSHITVLDCANCYRESGQMLFTRVSISVTLWPGGNLLRLALMVK